VAELPSRTIGLAIDLVVQVAALVGLLLGVGLLSQVVDDTVTIALTILTIVTVVVVLPTTWETLTRGKSLGKYVMGERVVRLDGGTVRLRHSLIRSLTMFFDLWLLSGVPGLLCALFTSKAQRFGDIFAGTMVIRERVPAAARTSLAGTGMPPYLSGWASSASVAAVPDRLALQARSLVQRAPQMLPEASASLAYSLASEVAPYVAPAPPYGTPPLDFLAAVISERTRRSVPQAQIDQGTPITHSGNNPSHHGAYGAPVQATPPLQPAPYTPINPVAAPPSYPPPNLTPPQDQPTPPPPVSDPAPPTAPPGFAAPR
jgi:uncharacterized RDD family membrane protein YckC